MEDSHHSNTDVTRGEGLPLGEFLLHSNAVRTFDGHSFIWVQTSVSPLMFEHSSLQVDMRGHSTATL